MRGPDLNWRVPMTTGITQERASAPAAAPGLGLKLATASFGVMLAWIALEVVLRVVPGLISPRLLVLFEPGLRADIADGAFPLEKDFRPIERTDGGPPLLVARPDTPIVSVDVPAGNVARRSDETGFCNPRGRYDGRSQIDVITVGDSFTWCHALLPDQTWTFGLETRSGLSTYDLGLGGLGPYEYLEVLREFGLAKKPRIVVMNIYGGNDLRDSVDYHRYREAVREGKDPPADGPQPVAPALAASIVGRHSYALNLLLAMTSRAVHRSSDQEKKGVDLHYTIDGVDGPIPFNLENRDRDEVVAARHATEPESSPALWSEALVRFGALGREHEFRPVVTYTPSAHTVYADQLRFEDPSVKPVLASLDDAQRTYLSEHAWAYGYDFFDLTPALREAARQPRADRLLYDPVHMHFTARGHEVVARALAEYFARVPPVNEEDDRVRFSR